MIQTSSHLTREIRYLIWDWNGTLLDDVRLCVEVVNRMLEAEGRLTAPVTVESYREQFGFPVIEYYRKVGFPTDAPSFARLSEDFIRYFNAGIPACDLHVDAVGLLEQWQRSGRKQALLSASRHDHLEAFVTTFKLHGFFTAIGGIEDIYAGGKVERGRRLIHELGWEPKETLLIGDTCHDYEVSCELGTRCFLVASGHQSVDRLKTTGAEVASSVRELKDRLFTGRLLQPE